MSEPNGGPSPRTRSLVVGIVVTLWAISVGGQLVSQFFRFDWVAPSGLNEIATAVVMWILARNHQATKEHPDPPASSRPSSPPPTQDREDEPDE